MYGDGEPLIERSLWFRTALVVIVFSAIVFLADALGRVWGFLGDLVLILFLSWLVGSLLIHVVNNLMRVPHMPRGVAILIVYLGLINLVLVFAFLVIPATSKQVLELAEKVPTYVEQLPGLVTNTQNFLAGLGIELDWDYVKAHPYQALNLRTFHDRDNALPLI